MAHNDHKYAFTFACLLFFLFVCGCAGRNYLLVDYQVPMASQVLNGQAVRLEIEDRRETKEIMTPEAAYQFPDFSGIYSLAWITPDQERILAGEHQLRALFKTALEKRLADQGVAITNDINAAAPVMTITLKQFNIDLHDHKWTADLGYEAVLTRQGHPRASENVHGRAERVRVIGRKGADTVISEIFSDAINRLDLEKLFRNAELIR